MKPCVGPNLYDKRNNLEGYPKKKEQVLRNFIDKLLLASLGSSLAHLR